MEKKRYEIQIAGAELAILSDEREEFINSLVENLDSKIREITVSSKRSSNLDAAILCALEYYSEKVKAEKRARNLEAQISLYDANLRRFREENLALRAKLEKLGTESAPEEEKESESASDKAELPVEEKAEPTADEAAPEKENEAAPADDDPRAARLRAIEELLGRGGKKD